MKTEVFETQLRNIETNSYLLSLLLLDDELLALLEGLSPWVTLLDLEHWAQLSSLVMMLVMVTYLSSSMASLHCSVWCWLG